jgi:hypothetical protein
MQRVERKILYGSLVVLDRQTQRAEKEPLELKRVPFLSHTMTNEYFVVGMIFEQLTWHGNYNALGTLYKMSVCPL